MQSKLKNGMLKKNQQTEYLQVKQPNYHPGVHELPSPYYKFIQIPSHYAAARGIPHNDEITQIRGIDNIKEISHTEEIIPIRKLSSAGRNIQGGETPHSDVVEHTNKQQEKDKPAIRIRVRKQGWKEIVPSDWEDEEEEPKDPLESCKSPTDFINGPVDESVEPSFVPTKQNPLPLTYNNSKEDPSVWPCYYKKCRGNQQSPINIDTEVIEEKQSLDPLEFNNYDKPLEDLPIENIGKMVYVSIPQCANLTVTSKWLKATYRLLRLTVSYKKSFHTIDSKYFRFELLLLHLNTKYKSVVNNPDAVLSIHIMFQVAKKNNEALEPIVEVLKEIKKLESNTTLKSPLVIADIFPKMKEAYVTYNGSRIVPHCAEVVKYIIFHYSNTIGKDQLKKFSLLQRVAPEDKDRAVVRPIQALNERKIWSTASRKDQKEGWW
ncbi:carbonic anhydrase 2-like [Centruroides vittatus]|uniref:carbonic anhydrase 2-like n=1 Tax=Centruroides vittatus TaxID=120091 RepID=UPI003510C3EB